MININTKYQNIVGYTVLREKHHYCRILNITKLWDL